MLERLSIKNYLIIKESEIEFDKGMNVLTGETGAGKSIILDALAMILGDRADYSLIRKDQEKMVIEGFFIIKENETIKKLLEEKEIDFEKEYLIIRREILNKGISRNFINDSPVSISDIKQIGDMIVDIHSQNEHQSLLKKETHIILLDSFCGLENEVKEYTKKFSEFKNLMKSYKDFLRRKDEIIEKKKYIEFQLKEINDVNPGMGEYEELERKLQKMENSEEMSIGINNVINNLYESESNVTSLISQSLKEIEKFQKYDEEIKYSVDELNESFINVKDAVERLQKILYSLDFDPVETEQVRDRLGSLNFLKKKFNKPIDEIISYTKELIAELELAENFDLQTGEMKKDIEVKKAILYKSAEKLSEKRKRNCVNFEKSVNGFLKEVGLESAEFKTDFSYYSDTEQDDLKVKKNNMEVVLNERGIDNVEFLIRTNKGGEMSSLRKSASGGEVSRIMLTIKASMAGKDDVPVLVFDEIDIGISGRIADKVGKVMKQLAKKRQIIAVTHLPQIAALSDKHFSVIKKEKKEETETEIKHLKEKDRIEEIAKMLSGEKITDASRQSARQLLGN